MYLLPIPRIDRMRLRLIAVPRIRALVVDLHHHTCTDGEPIGRVPVTLGRNVPALAAAFADARDYTGSAAIDTVATDVRAAGEGEVIGGGKTGAAGL